MKKKNSKSNIQNVTLFLFKARSASDCVRFYVFLYTHNLKDVLEAVTSHYVLREVRGVRLESMYDEMNINEI
jgi:hypothetical protein